MLRWTRRARPAPLPRSTLEAWGTRSYPLRWFVLGNSQGRARTADIKDTEGKPGAEFQQTSDTVVFLSAGARTCQDELRQQGTLVVSNQPPHHDAHPAWLGGATRCSLDGACLFIRAGTGTRSGGWDGLAGRSLGNDAKKSRRGRRRREPADGGDGASQDTTRLGNAGFWMECIHEQRTPSSQKAAIEKGGHPGGEGRGLGVEKAVLGSRSGMGLGCRSRGKWIR